MLRPHFMHEVETPLLFLVKGLTITVQIVLTLNDLALIHVWRA